MNKFDGSQNRVRGWREDIMIGKFKKDIGQIGLAKAAMAMLDSINAKLNFEKEGDESYCEIRRKLNSEAGLAIANHPGNFDLLCILAAIDRKDLKFMVAGDAHEMWSKLFGEEFVVPSLHMHSTWEEAEKAKEERGQEKLSSEEIERRQKVAQENLIIVRSILDHIKKGGLFIYFPTGGDDSRHMERFRFENLFRLLVSKMKPEDMVYSFNILSPEKERSKLDQSLRMAGSFSDANRSGRLNVSRMTEPISILADENYSEAGEWKKLINGSKGEDNEALTEHYLKKFPDFRSIVENARGANSAKTSDA